LLLLLIDLAHIIEAGVVTQFTIYIVIGLVISTEHQLVETTAQTDGI
jgi:hypothetical protein